MGAVPLQPPLWAPAVVAELDDVVGVAAALRSHDALKQGLRLLLPIHHQAALEEPMAAVLAAGGGGDGRVSGVSGGIRVMG